MKKLMIVTRNMDMGGAERVIAQLSKYFDEKGYLCQIVTVEEARVAYSLNKTVEVISIGRKSENKLINKCKQYGRLRKIVKKEKPDVVLSLPEEIGIYVILALLGTGYPVYVSERNSPWVMPDRKVTRILRKMMYPFAKGFIFQTEMAKSFFSKKIQARGVVIPNPVDISRIPEQYKGERSKTIVAAGRLEKQKNYPLLIESFEKFKKENPEYRLVIYGEGSLRNELEKLISDKGLKENVSLPGRSGTLLSEMNGAGMFVLSSDYEGMPNVLVEAMCMGMPVISTDCPSGGPKELISNGENGLLVGVNNVAEMVEAMEKLKDGIYAEKLANRAYDLRNKLTSESVFEMWEQKLQ